MAQATLSFSGFSKDDLAEAQAQFEHANAKLSPSWQLVDESHAHVLVIDMDSMYGHMGWLKAQGSGKVTVGVTTSARSEADFTLTRPLDAGLLYDVLAQIASRLDKEPEPEPESQVSLVDVIAARTTGQQPVIAARTTGQQPALSPHSHSTGQQPAISAVPRGSRLTEYLVPGRMAAPVRLALPGLPELALDPARSLYAGSAALKPLLPLLEHEIHDGDWISVSAAQFEQIAARSGGPQPYLRLLWLCGLYAGRGLLMAEFNPNSRYKLGKWPQTEREFPKHFRIATVMMKGPATLTEISDHSGASLAEVTDYVNAGLVSGIVIADGAPPTTATVARATDMLSRMA